MDSEIYLTEEEHNMFAQEDDYNTLEVETKQHPKRISKCNWWFLENKIKLRSRDAIINKGRPNSSQPSSSQQYTTKQTKQQKEKQKENTIQKVLDNKKEMSKEIRQQIQVDVDRAASSFNLQFELSKIKILVPFNESLRNN